MVLDGNLEFFCVVCFLETEVIARLLLVDVACIYGLAFHMMSFVHNRPQDYIRVFASPVFFLVLVACSVADYSVFERSA